MTKLGAPAKFFSAMRVGLLGPDLSEDEVSGCNALLEAMGQAGWPITHVAYGLATAFHETAHTMQPIRESGGPKYLFRMYDPHGERPLLAQRNGNTTPGDGVRYCGRGYVQITWKRNYERFAALLDKPLVTSPDLACDPEIAADILVLGMAKGLFTGVGLISLPALGSKGNKSFYSRSRRIINGMDCADLIAGYAVKFEDALRAGDWS